MPVGDAEDVQRNADAAAEAAADVAGIAEALRILQARRAALDRLARGYQSGLRGVSRRNSYLIYENREDILHAEDFSFAMDAPYDLNSDSQAHKIVVESYGPVATYEMESTYSYMIPEYEALRSLTNDLAQRLPTPMLPNIYIMNMLRKTMTEGLSSLELHDATHTSGKRLRELLTRVYALHVPSGNENLEQQQWADIFRLQRATDKQLLKEGSFYFQDFAKKAASLLRGDPFWLVETTEDYEKGSGANLAEQSIRELSFRNKNIILNENSILEMKELTENIEVFPMHNSIRFSTDTSTNLAEALGEADLMSFLIPFIASRVNSLGQYRTREAEGTVARRADDLLFGSFSAHAVENYDIVGTSVDDVSQERTSNITVPTFDLYQCVQLLSTTIGIPGGLWNKLHLGYSHTALLDIVVDPESADRRLRHDSALDQMIGTSGLRRNIEAIIEEFAPEENYNYNETLFYEIVKKPKNAEGYINADIQRIFIPNFSSLDTAEYIDTQVHYGESYEYQVFAWEAVMGIDSGETLRQMGARQYKLKVMRVPYIPGSPAVTVLDRPPMPPRTVVYPYVGVSDKLLLSLGAQRGEAFLKPDILGATGNHSREFAESFDEEHQAAFGRPSDLAGYTELWEASTRKQKKVVDGFEHLLFRSDESLVDRFEIYRTTEKPVKIEDFTGKLHKIVPTHMATNAAHVDNVEPNVKYYYAVRTVDPHNQVSNLSHIYEVELVMDDLGTFYMTQRVLDLKEEGFYEDSLNKIKKGFKKRMQVLPAIRHKIISEGTYAEDEDYCALTKSEVVLGIESSELSEDKLWGKKFKIRISSRDSGRKIDLNVSFTHTHNPGGSVCEE